MTAQQNDFLELYTHYRVDRSLREKDERAWQARVWRARLLVFAAVLFGAAAVAEVLAVTKVTVVIGAALAAAGAIGGLALVAGIVMSAAGGEVSGVRDETGRALARLMRSRPGPKAGDRDVADWVRRVEDVLGQGGPGADPPVAS
jgi:hypothetical protein